MPKTSNEELRDLLLARQVGIFRLANRNVRELTRILEKALKQSQRDLHRRLAQIQAFGADRGPWTTAQIRHTIRVLESILSEAYATIGEELESRLRLLTEAEINAVSRALSKAIPQGLAGVDFSYPSLELLRAIVTKKPMHGGQIGAYFAKQGKRSLVKATLRRFRKYIEDEVALGLLKAESVDKVTARIYNKIRKIARWQLRSVVDTATKHIAMESRQAFLEANAGADGVVKGYQWLSTLDLHTTKEYCIPRDGRLYNLDFEPVGHGYEWGAGPGRIHWGCRSSMTSVLRSWEELGIDADELEPPDRASMDGQVAGTTNARDWLKNRDWSRGELEEMFGKKRAQRILDGDLSVEGALRRYGIKAA